MSCAEFDKSLSESGKIALRSVPFHTEERDEVANAGNERAGGEAEISDLEKCHKRHPLLLLIL